MSRFKLIVGAIVLAFGFAFISGGSASTVIPDTLKPVPMPIQRQGIFHQTVAGGVPEPHREESVRKWLAPVMRIRNGGVSGSGTICHYDKDKNLAYVISCSHLFKSAGEKTVTLEFFYKNEKKLNEPARFKGDVVAAKINGYEDDISFISFTPDWNPTYFPIAPIDTKYEIGGIYNSVGCDHAGEVALYYVKVTKLEKSFLATQENSPRPGRSGGGLISKDGWYVGICVRTSDVSGQGSGYFVHLGTIHSFCLNNNLKFLLESPKIQRNQFLLTAPTAGVDESRLPSLVP
jgi:hypothetical protein